MPPDLGSFRVPVYFDDAREIATLFEETQFEAHEDRLVAFEVDSALAKAGANYVRDDDPEFQDSGFHMVSSISGMERES